MAHCPENSSQNSANKADLAFNKTRSQFHNAQDTQLSSRTGAS